MMSNVPVLQAVRAAEAFRKLHWRRVAGVLGALAGANLLAAALSLGAPPWQELLLQAALIPLMIMGAGALQRLAFADEHPGDPEFAPGPLGFQWRGTEWRLAQAMAQLFFLAVLGGLFLTFVLILFSVVGAMLGLITPQGDAAAMAPQMQGLVAAVGVAFLALAIYVWLRLILFTPATVAEKKVMVMTTWPLTKGQALPILAAVALINIPIILATMLLGGVIALLMGVPAEGPRSVGEVIAIGAAPSLIAGFIITPLNAGLAAFLYRGLRPAAPSEG